MKKLTSSIVAALFLMCSNSFAASTSYVSIGTGAVTGIYYPAGGAICRLLNLGRMDHGIRCSVESTNGSVSNLNSIKDGGIDFGIVQSDWLYHAYNGSGFFSDQKPFKELRSVFSIHSETFAIVVRNDSDIKTLDNLVGKKVNFGPEGSGTYATMKFLMSVKNWTSESFAKINNLAPAAQISALCQKNIDVMLYTSGNPNGVLQEASQACKVRIIPVDSDTIKAIIEKNPFYVEASIPGGIYAGNPNDIKTFGVNAMLVTSSKTSDNVVYNMTKSVFDNFDNFRTLHPVFLSLKKEDMIGGVNSKNKGGAAEGKFPPIHPGALKYFRETGLLK
jgi:TRAP transporter TAXI family solute receptor